jgi:hypothetical protein
MYLWVSYEEKNGKNSNLLGKSLKSLKKVVGSGVGFGSGSISKRYGSGDPDSIRIRTKMSRIPNTAFYFSALGKFFKIIFVVNPIHL